uniref:SH2 domain-containing protein n=1 Tax=Caenorhabditis tropicalis TaxID=1561998 RepID=A0A1I7T2R8_9PELO
MQRLQENRWEQLRAIESEILAAPPPSDPFQMFPPGWTRAAELSENDWFRMSKSSPPPPPQVPDHRRQEPRRPMREINGAAPPPPLQQIPRRRPVSPTELPGVRAIPKDYNRLFRGLLTPGEFFVKSQTRYLGPFDEVPTEADVPQNDDYIVLQRMGRLPESGKSIFRQVGTLST